MLKFHLEGIDNIKIVDVSNIYSSLKTLKENNWLIIALDEKPL